MSRTELIAIVGVCLGAASASANVPAWCSAGAFVHASKSTTSKLSSKDAGEVVATLAASVCSSDAEAVAHRAEIEAARQAWGAKLGMQEADWADAAAYATGNRYPYLGVSTPNYAESSPIDQYQQIESAGGAQVYGDTLYIADLLDSRLTEVGRLALIRWCVGTAPGEEVAGHANAVKWAVCQHDIDAFDRKKFDEQIRSDTAHKGDARMWMRLVAYALPARLKEHADAVHQIWKQDPAFKQAFDLAAQARADWTSLAAASAKSLALALALDSATAAQSRRAFLDARSRRPPRWSPRWRPCRRRRSSTCTTSATTRRRASARAPPRCCRRSPPSRSRRSRACCVTPERENGFLAAVVGTTARACGPRTLDGSSTPPSCSTTASSTCEVHPSFSRRPYLRSSGDVMGAGGPVKSVKADGEIIVVQLEATSIIQHDCVQEHRTNRITRIRESVASSTRASALSADVKHDNTWAPFKLVKADEHLAKPGAVISVVFGDGVGETLASWPNKAARAPAMLLGARLK